MIRTRALVAVAPLVLLAALGAVVDAAEPVSISGTTWFDANFDGIRQDTEGELWKLPVRVERADSPDVVATGETGVGGRYEFTDLPPGRYKVIIAALTGAPGRWPTRQDVGDDRTDSDIDQLYGQSNALDCPGGPCTVADGGFAESHLDVGIEVDPAKVMLPPQGRASVKVTVTNTGTRPWWASVYLPPQGVAVENPGGEGWVCNTVDPRRPNCSRFGEFLMPDETRQLWFDVVTAGSPSGTVDVSVLPGHDDNPANNHGLVHVTAS
jgi:hypothetical protein